MTQNSNVAIRNTLLISLSIKLKEKNKDMQINLMIGR